MSLPPNESDVICAGIIVADHVCTPIHHLPVAGELVLTEGIQLSIGGCAANTAVDLAKLGQSCAVVGRVGADIYGELIGKMLEKEGVSTAQIIKTTGIETSQTLIVLVKNQDRRFVHSFGANAKFTADDVDLTKMHHARVLYVGGYLLMPALEESGLATLLQTAQRMGKKTVLDVGIPYPGDYLPKLRKVLPFVDVFLPNEDEGRIILDEKDPFQQALQFQKMGAKTVVVTRGEHGSVMVTSTRRIKAGIFNVKYVDGSGSGDAFDAGFIYGILRNEDEIACLTQASAMGASCVRSLGTTPGVFTSNELKVFLSQNQLSVSTW